uniref:NADH dehydrogenase subunit 6 n=2 Tax=unclassified Physidae TaxID=1724862 RepID=A0A8F8SQP0_9GAST|nr:NADH dehydrogenase subunit 6 [Physidae sp. PE4]QYB18820.1 NADH dehydrogenase subunit 6 [Physidae sp. P3S_19]
MIITVLLWSIILSSLLSKNNPFGVVLSIVVVISDIMHSLSSMLPFLFILYALIYIGGVLAMVSMVCMVSSNLTFTMFRKSSVGLCGVCLFVLSPNKPSLEMMSNYQIYNNWIIALIVVLLVVMVISKTIIKKNTTFTCYK